jgi:AraC family transcriptional activator FtrA
MPDLALHKSRVRNTNLRVAEKTISVYIMPTSPFRHHIVVLAYEGLCTFEFGIAVEMFGLPRPELEQWYTFEVCSLDKGPLQAIGGLKVIPARRGTRALEAADTILIPGWRGAEAQPPRQLVNALRKAHERGARLVSICSGVFVVAATGLLDGKSATTHWRYTDQLAQRFPSITVKPDVLYVDEGTILTSAGSAAGMDLCLHIIRKDLGPKVANQVARRLVIPPHREGGQAQFVDAPVGDAATPWLSLLFDWVQTRLHKNLSIKHLAQQSRMSPRTFARKFVSATGASPGDWITGLRIRRAKDLLELTALSIEEIAARCGFGSAAILRHHFRRRVNLAPNTYRARFTVI